MMRGRASGIAGARVSCALVSVVSVSLGCYSTHADTDGAGVDGFVDGTTDGTVRDDGGGDAGPAWRDLVTVEQTPPARVDIVVLVDNSATMGREQEVLAQRFPELIRELTDPGDADGDGRPDHPAVEDLNIGIVSTDMGTAGYRVSTCSNSEVGDDGCFRHTPSPVVPGCASWYPSFLSRNPENADSYTPDDMSRDFACIATLGTNGCGFEQPLKAMRKALTDNVLPGGCNSGFLRPDSLLALVFVTDEDDCSVRPDHPEMFDVDRFDLGHLSIRCFLHPEYVVPVEEYVAAFRALRGDPDRLLVGLIVGVPPDAAACIGSGSELEGCLDVPAMAERIDPAAPMQLMPSCITSMGLAYPPVRLLRLALALGANAYVDSVCKTDWSDVISGVVERLAEPVLAVCTGEEAPLDPATCRTRQCFLIETLSDDRECGEDLACRPSWCPSAAVADLPGLAPCRDPASGEVCEPLERDLGLTTGADGRPRRLCLVREATRPVLRGGCDEPTTAGWYYEPSAGGECSLLVLGPGWESLIDGGSTAVLRCFD